MEESRRDRFAVRDHEAAELLGVSTSCLRAWRSQGRGPAFSRLGRRVVYPMEALKDFIRGNLVQGRER
jgi:predicted site-specific integrase-resolvase